MFRLASHRSALVIPTSTHTRLATRSYFYAGVGETGIYGASLKAFCMNMTKIVCVVPFYLLFYVVGDWNSRKQFAPYSSDLYVSDGTEMEGEEAVANLKLQHERIMPFMEEIREKLEAAQQ